jgi:cell wall-associated NlpC family hydrolase
VTTPANAPAFGPVNVGGAGGTLIGTGNLQQSIDQLTNAVNSLSTQMGTMSFGGGSGTTTSGGGAAGSFPAPVNPFNNNPPQPGIGGGGPGGAGNVQVPTPFSQIAGGAGAVAGAFAGYGNQQLPTQLALNAYATQQALAAGQGGTNNFTTQYKQVFGYQGQGLNFLAASPLDAITGTQMLNTIAGSSFYGNTSQGRAGFGYAAAFGISNPLASFQQGAGFAQQIMSPQTSQTMMALGYPVTPRQMGTGKANSPAAVVQGMLRAWYGKNKVNSNTLTAGLGMNGTATLNLNALGIDSTTAAPLIEEYNQLFNAGLTPAQAQKLINQAGSGTLASARAAQKRLSSLGVTTAQSSAQDMRNNQSVLTGRDADVASGFSRGLEQATSLLSGFNNALSHIMTTLHLNGVTGYAGGISSIASGTNFGNSLLGVGGVGGILGGFANLAGLGGGAMNSSAVVPMTSQSNPSGSGSGSGSGKTKANNGGSITGQAISAVSNAESQLGVPYQWGGEQPGVGFDCSGLVQWAYAQAGVQLPRTSETQWSALSRRAVPLTGVQEGDLVFMAGGDGTPNNPGHVGMMVNNNQLIQAPMPGEDVQIIGYDPRQWSHAARPTGSLMGAFLGSSGLGGTMSSNSAVGNSGTGIGAGAGWGSYGSISELDAMNGALGSGAFGVSGGGSYGSNGTSTQTNANPGSGGGTLGGTGVTSGTPADVQAAVAYGKQLASSEYQWSGNQWNDLYKLWMKESGWEYWATNPSGGNPSTSAYGIPQARPGSKLATGIGTSGPSNWETNYKYQIDWGAAYIYDTYKNPVNAWAHEQKYNWYGAGGTLTGGISIVGDRGPEAIVGGAGAQVLSNSDTMALINANPQPAQNPWTNINDLSSNNMIPFGQQGNINLNFGPGSVVIKVENSGSADSSYAGRQVAKNFIKFLADEEMFAAIGMGNKNGFN